MQLFRLDVYGAACLAVIALRCSKPNGAWFSVPGGKLIPVAGIVLCLLFFARVGRWELGIIAIVALVGVTNWMVASSESSERDGNLYH
jgi:hypothetical protein